MSRTNEDPRGPGAHEPSARIGSREGSPREGPGAHTDPAAIGLRVKAPDEVRLILAELRRRLEELYGDRLRGLYLFGSYAREDAQPGSDLDVLLVLDRIDSYWTEIERGGDITAGLSLQHDLPITRVFVSEADWRRGDSPLLRNVRKEGRAA